MWHGGKSQSLGVRRDLFFGRAAPATDDLGELGGVGVAQRQAVGRCVGVGTALGRALIADEHQGRIDDGPTARGQPVVERCRSRERREAGMHRQPGCAAHDRREAIFSASGRVRGATALMLRARRALLGQKRTSQPSTQRCHVGALASSESSSTRASRVLGPLTARWLARARAWRRVRAAWTSRARIRRRPAPPWKRGRTPRRAGRSSGLRPAARSAE